MRRSRNIILLSSVLISVAFEERAMNTIIQIMKVCDAAIKRSGEVRTRLEKNTEASPPNWKNGQESVIGVVLEYLVITFATSALQTNEPGRKVVVHHVNPRNEEEQEQGLEILFF